MVRAKGNNMPNRCTFCTIIRPTNHLILGTTWLEFCERCGEKETLQRQTDNGIEIKSIREIFDITTDERRQREQI
jgi:hypothetical protein